LHNDISFAELGLRCGLIATENSDGMMENVVEQSDASTQFELAGNEVVSLLLLNKSVIPVFAAVGMFPSRMLTIAFNCPLYPLEQLQQL
jgi:hypothetical protein